MSNYIDPYKPIFYAQEALILLEEALGMAGRVHRGYDLERKSANVGDTIQITRPSTFTTQAGGTGTSGANEVKTSKVDITVDTWREVKFGLTDQELAFTGEKIISDHISPAVYAIANYMETSLTNLYKYVPWSFDADSTFSANDIVGARKILRDNAGPLVDSEMVHFGIDSTIESQLLQQTIFHSASVAGADQNKEALLRGHLGIRFGVEHFVQQTYAAHTSGTVISAENDVAGALAADEDKNSSTISISGLNGSETLAVGDSFVITKAGSADGDETEASAQRYVVAEAATLTAGANSSVSVWPHLRYDYHSGDVVTFETISSSNYADSYYPNLMFHRNSFAIAMAPLSFVGDEAGARMAVVTDPRTGLSIRSRLAYDDDNAKVWVTLDVLYGVKCIEPNLAVVVRRNA